MLKNNLKIAIRSLLRQKGFSLINILGLTVGLTCSLLMLLWVQHERSYDNFHTNLANIYQLKSNVKFGNGTIETWSGTPYPYSVSLVTDYPEVEGVAVTTYNQEHLFTVDTKKGKEKGLYANAALFKLFDFPFVEGNPNKALDNPNSMVLSQKLAKKYFGNSWQSAIGQAI